MTSIRYVPPGCGSDSIVWPIQRTAFAGSTRSSQTVSGLAAMASSRSTFTCSTGTCSAVAFMLSLLLSFRLLLERLQARVPEPVEERLQLGEPLGARAVQAPRAVASLAHEPRLLQHSEVLGDRRSRQLEVRRDLAGGKLRRRDEAQDRAAVRRGDRP